MSTIQLAIIATISCSQLSTLISTLKAAIANSIDNTIQAANIAANYSAYNSTECRAVIIPFKGADISTISAAFHQSFTSANRTTN